ncbi:MAG: hypothetical protein A2666_01385 [Parcubacteria group bacterium RIFCSPHIGHO2_01_FULL_47_10b]|nr:MAG: hypothetical protein A2666_01385 [Parcubacteria group bacterium RIFCSPHIGHO2_01_FULL_47_10b]
MIFFDSSAIIALASKTDEKHQRAQRLLQRLYESGESLCIHNYVIVEAMSILQNRLGVKTATQFTADIGKVQCIWITQQIHDAAKKYWMNHSSRRLSFVDCVSFVTMKLENITTAFAFDQDFQKAGFELYGKTKS